MIVNRLGLHARAATVLVQTMGPFDAAVVLEKDGQRARATSVIELLLLCAHEGTSIVASATGSQAQEALLALSKLVADRFGEDV